MQPGGVRPPPLPPLPGRRPGRRWDLLAAWAAVLGPALALGLWAAGRQRVSDLEERLVRDANATFGVARPRPIHRQPAEPGTLSERLARHLPAVRAQVDGLGTGTMPSARRLLEAGEPAPSAVLAAAERLRDPLREILAGTRAAAADLPAELVELRLAPAIQMTDLLSAGTFAAVEARRELEHGDPRAASTWCADGMALARDTALAAPGMLGRVTSSRIIAGLTFPCAEVLQALPERRGLAAQLRAVRDGFPTLADTLQNEALLGELSFTVGVLSPEASARLSPTARALAAGGAPPSSAFHRWYIRDGWRGFRASLDDGIRAAAVDDELDRELALERAGRVGTRRWINVMPQIALPDWSRYVRRIDAALRRLDALVLAAAALDHCEARGAWPDRVAALVEGGWLDPAEARRLSGVGFTQTRLAAGGAPQARTCERNGTALSIEVPLPGNPSDPESLELPLR